MIQNISMAPRAQVRANTPNFGKSIIEEPVRKLCVLGKDGGLNFIPRPATNEETKTALQAIGELLDQGLSSIKRTWFQTPTGKRENIEAKAHTGALLALEKSHDKVELKHIVYENGRKIESFKVDNRDGDISINNNQLLEEVAAKMVDAVKHVPATKE